MRTGAMALAVLAGLIVACANADSRQPAKLPQSATQSATPAGVSGSTPDSPAPPLASTDAPGLPGDSVPLVRGLTLVSVYQVPEGERENTVVVNDVTPEGAEYGWRYRERRPGSADINEDSFTRFVSAADLAGAPRLNSVFRRESGREETPGYTAMSLSRAVYNRLRVEGQAPYTTMGAPDSGSALDMSSPVPYRGTLAVTSAATESMPVLWNGRRVSLPTMHVHGRFTYQTRSAGLDFWVLADSAHPLILRGLSSKGRLFQMVRIDLPRRTTVEAELERACRAELPGIYFGFASSELQPASEPAVAGVAALLDKHADWSLAVEGHTDSIGDDTDNRRLSLARAETVRSALVERGVFPARLRAEGYGATRPRESNSTLEGRARNRRVELVRNCGAS